MFNTLTPDLSLFLLGLAVLCSLHLKFNKKFETLATVAMLLTSLTKVGTFQKDLFLVVATIFIMFIAFINVLDEKGE